MATNNKKPTHTPALRQYQSYDLAEYQREGFVLRNDLFSAIQRSVWRMA
jgi:hypothetical protein